MNLIEHIEGHFGEISEGWKASDAPDTGIQVVLFANVPFENADTFCTIGLSESVLQAGPFEARMELLFSVYNGNYKGEIAEFLLSLAESAQQLGTLISQGDVYGPHKPIISSTEMNCVYCTLPVVFSASSLVYKASNPPTFILWIIPIYLSEASFIRTQGWQRFELLLEKEDPDLWDFSRSPML